MKEEKDIGRSQRERANRENNKEFLRVYKNGAFYLRIMMIVKY